MAAIAGPLCLRSLRLILPVGLPLYLETTAKLSNFLDRVFNFFPNAT
jgi:hypothetical protein